MTRRWQQISTPSLSGRVYQAIREKIVHGGLGPGNFIREQEVANGLGVSRTPVREALAQLARQGFVEKIPRRGFRVPEEPVHDLLELYPILGALEVLAAELAFPAIDAAVITQLRAINAELREAARRNHANRAIQLNHQFHHVLSERCGNRKLCDLLDELRAHVTRLELWSFSQYTHLAEALDQHDEILDALARGEQELALAKLRANRLQTYHAFRVEVDGRVSGAADADTPAAVQPPST